MKLKHFIATTLSGLLMCSPLLTFAGAARDVYVLNNQYNNIDYSVVASATDAAMEQLGITEPKYQTGEGKNNLADLSVEESYLISHEIIERPYSLSGKTCTINDYSMSEYCPKTLLYEMLYRSYYGPIVSRPLAFVEDATCSVLYTTNVYELYLRAIMDKGYVSREQLNTLNGNAFLASYDKLSSLPAIDAAVPWDNSLGATTCNNPTVLGLSNQYTSEVGVTIGRPSYFTEENMLTLDAIAIIAQFVRNSEKDMSQLESSIVAYKYGINYIPNVSDNIKSDIEFLIAKGILNFENPSEFTNLYGEFTYKDAIKLCYRVANADARLDFSKVQLTDQESFWMEKGYFANNMVAKQGTGLPNVQTITAEYWDELIANNTNSSNGGDINNVDKPDSNNFIDDLLGTLNVKKVNAAPSDAKHFTVTKMFDISYDYQYKGVPIAELSSSTDKPNEFVSYEEKDFSGLVGSTTKLAKVVFYVEAKSYENAVLYVDNNIAIKGGVTEIDLQAYTTIDEDGKEVTLVSQTSLKAGFSQISVIEDKVLLNKDTGVTAILLPEEGYALVGNRVVITKDLIMTDTSDEVYYNLDVICTLLSNSYLSKLTDREIYTCNALAGEKLVDVVGTQGNTIGATYTCSIAANSVGPVDANSFATYFNVDNLDKGINALSRKITAKTGNGKTTDVYFVVEWEYVVPDSSVLANMLDNNLLLNAGLTMNDVNEAVYTRPVDSDLAEWWDSNKSISNSLANFMYGTTGVEYVKSGYLVPNLTVLRDTTVDDAAISSIFTTYGFKLDDIGMKYCIATTKWWENYYSAGTMQSSEMKALAMANRKFQFLNAQNTSDGARYGNSYFVTKCGVLYQNCSINDKLEAKNGKLYLRTRKLSGSANPPKGTLFEYNGRSWMYLCNTTLGDQTYFTIIPAFAVPEYKNAAIVKTDNYEVLAYTKNVGVSNEAAIMKQAEERYNKLYKTYLGDVTPPDFGEHKVGSYMYGVCDEAIRYYEGKGNIYNSSWYVQGNGLYAASAKKASVEKNKQLGSLQGKNIVVVPKIYLPCSSFSFIADEENYTLLESSLATALGMNHVFTSGISRSVIDSVIYKHTKTIPVNSMLVNQRILIGDIMYTRTTDDFGKSVFVSDPIYNVNLTNALKYSDYSEDLGTIKNSLFAGIAIDYGGYNCYLSSFVKKANVGNLSNAPNGVGVLFAQSGSKRVYLDGASKAAAVDSAAPQAVCISIQLEDGLFARPTNDKQNTYVLLNVSSIMGDKTVDDIPFFSESLSYGDESSDYVAITNSKFNPSSLYNSIKTNYKRMIRKAFTGDIITIIWMFIFYFSVYFAIMAWIMYFILTLGYTRKMFEILTVPSGKGKYLRNGFDLIKIVTFGVYNIDSEPAIARTTVTSFICFFISYAIVFWHPF